MLYDLAIGTLPTVYTAQVFPQHARLTAVSLATAVNFTCLLIVKCMNVFTRSLLHQDLFTIFVLVLCAALIVLIRFIKETSNKSCTEIRAEFDEDQSSENMKDLELEQVTSVTSTSTVA